MTDVSLNTLFDFTDFDLETNRNGRLSERQRQRLLAQAHEAAASQLGALVALPVVLLLIVLYFVVMPPLGDRLGAWVCLLIPVSFAVIAALGMAVQRVAHGVALALLQRHAFSDWLSRRMAGYARSRERVVRGKVYALEGVLTVRSDGEHEHLFVGELELECSARATADDRLWQLTRGQAYSMYLVSDTDWIVAVEKMALDSVNSKPQHR